MAHPARTLPPLSFGDPELDAPANDTVAPPPEDSAQCLPLLTFASTPAPPVEPAAVAYLVPSFLPEAMPDPSFEAPKEQPDAPAPVAPVTLAELKPPPPAFSLEGALTGLLERAIERAPAWPAALRFEVPAPLAFAVALALLWMELGLAVRSVRAILSAITS